MGGIDDKVGRQETRTDCDVSWQKRRPDHCSEREGANRGCLVPAAERHSEPWSWGGGRGKGNSEMAGSRRAIGDLGTGGAARGQGLFCPLTQQKKVTVMQAWPFPAPDSPTEESIGRLVPSLDLKGSLWIRQGIRLRRQERWGGCPVNNKRTGKELPSPTLGPRPRPFLH